ncbi:PbsX family transcriptional regulator [Neisseria brasiliensis]|uniref:AbrB/MazE/SpoVT family DNA-binding domain-containing protein n=1 Tax=Neisseria TaxID=482 RepID=UPI0012A89145|nr:MULTISPECIES: PbsX family transcriptional regulator [Neisseria]QGL24428.1 PbsX family transcriptional regulator [Neisseria brasiliensis]
MKWKPSILCLTTATVVVCFVMLEQAEYYIREENGKIVIEPVKSRYCLDQLLSAIIDDNLHQEISSGEPVGKELL